MDICEPWESYSASRFRQDAGAAIAASHAAGRLPLLVGGTMLYYRALMEGLSVLPAADPAVRARLESRAQALGWTAMHQRLAEIDPVAARRIHPNDPQRIQRALEVWEISGCSLTELQRSQAAQRWPGALLRHALWPADRARLHARIEQRFAQMLQDGFIAEVESLRADARMHSGLPSMRCVGYRQAWAYLEGELDQREMQEKAVAATRQLAKRQFTWMRSMDSLSCYDVDADSAAVVVAKIRHRLRQQLNDEKVELQLRKKALLAAQREGNSPMPGHQRGSASESLVNEAAQLDAVQSWIGNLMRQLP